MDEHAVSSAIDLLCSTDGHARVLGPPGSGKTSVLLERFRYLEEHGLRGRIAVVTYTRESHESLLSQLIAENSACFGSIPVYTYHQLALSVIGASTPERRRLIGELEEAVLLRRLLRGIEGELTSDFKGTIRSVAFQKSVLGVLHALLQIGVGERHKRKLLDRAAPPRLLDLLKIYFVYREDLRSLGYFTYHDAAWIGAGLLEKRPSLNPLANAAYVLVEDFHDVDPGQYALIRAVASPDGGVTVNVFGDPTGARFRHRGTTDRFLLHTFPDEYRPADIVLPAGKANGEKLGPVVDKLLRETSGDESAAVFRGTGGGNVDVTMSVVENETTEAAFIAERVVSLVGSGLYQPDEIAVAVREKHKYESLLTRAFRERGLILETGRSGFSPFAYFVSSLLRLVDRPGNEAARNAVSTSPFFRELVSVYEEKTGTPAGDGPDDPVESLRTALVRTANRDNGGFDLLALVSEWIKPLLSTAVTETQTDKLLSFLGSLAVEWRKYCDIVDGSGGLRTLPEFLSLSLVLSSGGQHNRRAGRVGLYSCHELSDLRFSVVFLAGCSDLLFPALPERQNYIPWGILQDRLNAVLTDRTVELPRARSPKDFLKDEYALMLTALARSRALLVISAPKQHRGVTTPAPARVLKGLTSDPPPGDTGQHYAPYLRFAHAFTAARPEPANTGHRTSDLWAKPVESRINLRLKLKRLSPSTIKSYTMCPTQLFYSRVLRVDEDLSPGAAFGSLFHDLMNRLTRHYRTHIELSGVINSVRLDEHINKTIEASKYFSVASRIEQVAARFHLRDMMARFIEIDKQRTDDYYITTSEKQVGFEWHGWGFGGVADRVDRSPGGSYVVIDYKTGDVKKTGATIRKKSLPGFDKPDERLWQVPLYTKGARPGDARLPEMFCYYVIQPGSDFYPVGLVIGEETDMKKAQAVFGGAETRRFSYLTREELNACLDEAAGIAEDIFAKRFVFDRTSDRDRCSRCYFQRVCERTV